MLRFVLTCKMSLPSPEIQHPVFWALNSLCGLSQGNVAKLARVPRVTIRRMARGHDVTPEVLARLIGLLTDALVTYGERKINEKELKKQPDELAEYREAFFKAANYIVKAAIPAAPRVRPKTDLEEDILRQLGQRGERRAVVIHNLKQVHRAASVRRAVQRMGIETRVIDGQTYWLNPNPPKKIHHLPLPKPSVIPPTTQRGKVLHNLIVGFIGRQPDCIARASDVISLCVGNGYSKPSVYKAVKDMALNRETTGFGPDKVTRWGLPHVASQSDGMDTDEPDEPPSSKVIRVDFSNRRP